MTADTNSSRFDDDEAAIEFRSVLVDEIDDSSRKRSACGRRKAQEDHGDRLRSGVHKASEITVLSQKYPLFMNCQRDKYVVFGARVNFYDGFNVMASGPKCPHDAEIAAFVGQKAHYSFGSAITISSCASVSAAYVMAALISSLVRCG